jgi:hypothetical protein
MALLLIGRSACRLCGEPLRAEYDLAGLPALADTSHPLYDYFDQGYHQSCFARWEHREAALAAVHTDQQRFTESAVYQQLLQKFGKPGSPPTSL